jgi:hypothetical protein
MEEIKNILNQTKVAAMAAGTCLLAFSSSAKPAEGFTANPGMYEIGVVDPASPSSNSDELGYMQNLVGDYNGTVPSVAGYTYTLKVGSGVGSPPLINPTSAVTGPNSAVTGPLGGTSLTITLPITGDVYDYLSIKWGDYLEGYDIKGLSGTFTFSANVGDVHGDGLNGNGESHYTLYDPTPSGKTVPDGSSTVGLLGLGLTGLSLIRRKMK